MSWLIVLLIVQGVVLVGFMVILRRRRQRMANELQREFEGQLLLGATQRANFFGQKSLGRAQVRGNGSLVLDEDGLHFRMLLPDRRWDVPIRTILNVSTPRSFLGKSKLIKLLRIDYLREDGQADALAFAVPDLDRWVQAIQAAVFRVREGDRE